MEVVHIGIQADGINCISLGLRAPAVAASSAAIDYSFTALGRFLPRLLCF